MSPFVMMQIAAGILVLHLGLYLLVLLNIVNTVGEYILGPAVVGTGDARLGADAGFDAGVVFLDTHLVSLGVAGFARANIAVVLIALGVAVLLLREYRRLTTPATDPPSA